MVTINRKRIASLLIGDRENAGVCRGGRFQGTMYGTNLGPEMTGLGAFAYTTFYDSVLTATSTNMVFLTG